MEFIHPLSLDRAIRAVEKVRERLLRSTAALDRAGVPYAVIGGNAVAFWVARVDEDAVRNTVDVDILLNRADFDRAADAMREVGFDPAEVFGVPMFIERASPSPRRAVHVIYAGELIRPTDLVPAPQILNIERGNDGFSVIGLRELLVMKLSANRDKDRTHIRDMLELEMITPDLEAQLPPELLKRLRDIQATPQG